MTRLGNGASIVAAFLRLGMALAISFLEVPMKFRAPGITLTLGSGVGLLVFWALNRCGPVQSSPVLTARRREGMWPTPALSTARVLIDPMRLERGSRLPNDRCSRKEDRAR